MKDPVKLAALEHLHARLREMRDRLEEYEARDPARWESDGLRETSERLKAKAVARMSGKVAALEHAVRAVHRWPMGLDIGTKVADWLNLALVLFRDPDQRAGAGAALQAWRDYAEGKPRICCSCKRMYPSAWVYCPIFMTMIGIGGDEFDETGETMGCDLWTSEAP